MPTVGELSAAIAEPLSAAGIRTATYLADTFTPPIALVAIREITYHEAFGEPPPSLYIFDVFVVVGRADDRAGIAALEDYMSVTGPTSIRQALEADQTFGGVAETSVVVHAGPPASINIGGAIYISTPFELQVRA